jgi:TPR repeat protein
MRRQDIQLLVAARQGDVAARCEVGRRYLLGLGGFPRHVPSGIEHLTHPSVRALPQAARVIAEGLSLHELLAQQQRPALAIAAAAGSTAAQFKLGLICHAIDDRAADARRWFAAAAASGDDEARRAWQALDAADDGAELVQWLRRLPAARGVDAQALALAAAAEARAAAQLGRLSRWLRVAIALAPEAASERDQQVADAVALAEAQGRTLQGLHAADLRRALEARANGGDAAAAYALGRGLCGIHNPALDPQVFAEHLNLRKGAAFLLRAADAGCDAAWLHLYRLHANHRLSVANPQLARYFLEKAAARGQAEAQRKLGALSLREAANLADTEQGIHWLHLAAGRGDAHAAELLRSLVLPLAGSDDEAQAAIDTLRRHQPWLAARLELARAFGLTKLEALCVDPVEGLRPWGLVVGRNPFVTQARLAAPRAVPAPTPQALEIARRTAALFTQARHDALALEGDLRQRSLRQRRAFERHALAEAMFFADASAAVLDTLRLGPKWAFRVKEPLSLALAA